MKRLLCLLLAFTLLLGCAALPAGAEHTHKWKDLDTIQQPTCTTPGSKIQGCTVCGVTRDVMIPALGHEFSQQVYTGYADCTHYGSFYWVCERCGAHSAIGNDKPLGHDWDEGVITTMPQGFTPGVKTYTCKRDPSHTYTEEVDPIEWVFATLENNIEFPDLINNPIDLKDIPPLVITKQPVGGYVDQDSDEGLVLTVEAEGGEPPYTYEWYKTAQDEETLEMAKDFMTMLCMLFGMSEEEAKAKWADVTLENASVLVGEEQEFHATEGYFGYYCVVIDSGYQQVMSDIAKTKSTIDIWTHPSNANLMDKDSVTLSCLAYQGSGEFGYTWYKLNEEGEDAELGSGAFATEGFNAGKLNELEVDECGIYYCVAEDLVTGHTATSYTATVYAAPELSIYIDYPTETRMPGEAYELLALVSGGMPPYQVWWEYDGSAIPSKEKSDEDGILTAAESLTAGMYTVYAEDEVGNYIWQTITRYNTKLKIAEQPVGGIIHKYDYEYISMAVDDGIAPYHYTLYLNNKVYKEDTKDDAKATFTVEDPGVYYFQVEDSTGRQCTSATATFDLSTLCIPIWTPHASIESWDAPAHLYIEAEGGVEPYYYMWITIREDGSWYHNQGWNSPDFYTVVPGEYLCIVVDDENDSAYSKTMTVDYIGDAPLIVEQPKGGVIDDSGSFILTCKAVSGSGGELRYEWEKTATGQRPSWKSVSRSGSSNTSKTVYEAASYRCKVTDTKTGKYTYSNIVTVCKKLSVEVEPTGKGGLEGEFGQYKYTIKGGVPPYKLQVELVSQFAVADEEGNLIWTDFEAPYVGRYNITSDCTTNTFDLDMFYDFSYWDPIEQRSRNKWSYAKYNFVVNDALGSFDSTGPIDVFSDYKTGKD